MTMNKDSVSKNNKHANLPICSAQSSLCFPHHRLSSETEVSSEFHGLYHEKRQPNRQIQQECTHACTCYALLYC